MIDSHRPAVPYRTVHIARNAAVVAAIVFVAAMFGILTRPAGFLAAFWPANAILLGIMVRNRDFSTPAGWIAAFAAFVTADLVTGGTLAVTLWLSTANLSGALTGYLLYQQLPEEDRRLRRPASIVLLFVVCMLAAAVAALVGGGAARLLFDRDMLVGFAFWFVTELVNGVVVVPAILTAPSVDATRRFFRSLTTIRPRRLRHLAPAIVLVAAVVASIGIGGPGAFAYPLPALLWCALTYTLFSTALLTLCFSVWQMIAITTGMIPFPMGDDVLMSTMSIRLAIALMALGPLAVASINAARTELLERLRHSANHDHLTKALARAAFMRDGSRLLATAGGDRDKLAVLMLDIDHFKSVNDRFGHRTGDRVLVGFAATIAENLRRDDLFGRLGGEEFAVVLPRIGEADALAIAERIRTEVGRLDLADDEGRPFRITVSGGLACGGGTAVSLDTLLAEADKALYGAKSSGRNRIATARQCAEAR